MVGYCTRSIKKIIAAVSAIIFITAFALFSFPQNCGNAAFASGGSSEIVMEASSLRVLKGSDIDLRLPMASTTKIVTAIVVIENCELDKKVKIPKAAVGIEGSSIYLREGEELTVKELLYGLMLRSGNDAAVALAVHCAGSIEKFAEMMNLKAKSLGLKNSNFTNPHGLNDPNHYTSAYDLAVFAAYGMNNPVFKEIAGTKNITISGNNEEETRYLHNKNKILATYSGGNGIKTGYTKVAGRCLAAASLRDGMQVVSVVLNKYDMWERSAALMDYAHDNYRIETFADSGRVLKDVSVTKGRQDTVAVAVNKSFSYPVKKDGSEVPSVRVNLPESLSAPIKKGDIVGNIEITLGNHLLFSDKVYTIDDVKKETLGDKIKDFFRKGSQNEIK